MLYPKRFSEVRMGVVSGAGRAYMGVVHKGVVTRMAPLRSLKEGADFVATDARMRT